MYHFDSVCTKQQDFNSEFHHHIQFHLSALWFKTIFHDWPANFLFCSPFSIPKYTRRFFFSFYSCSSSPFLTWSKKKTIIFNKGNELWESYWVLSQYKTTAIRNYMAPHFFFLPQISFPAHQTTVSTCTVRINKHEREFDDGEGSSSCLLRTLHSYCVTGKHEGQNQVFRRNLYPSARVVCSLKQFVPLFRNIFFLNY